MKSCLKKARRALSVIKALISRSMFVLHGLICIWRVTVVKRNPVFWSLAGTIPVLGLETAYTLCRKKGREWKWICPSVVLYLATAVPAIWFLELELMRQRLMAGRRAPPQGNVTQDLMVLNGQVIHLAISLGSEEWCKILEQMLLLILIVGRWLLPKGEITREQLSQLLLVYIGMAADIIELFEAFKEKTVRENRTLTLIILSLWTASLTQFTLVLTAAKSKKTRPALFRSESASSTACSRGGKGCCPTETDLKSQGLPWSQWELSPVRSPCTQRFEETEEERKEKEEEEDRKGTVISILISVSLQDAPFLVLRMLLIFRYDVLSYTNIFFTSKNSLVLVLQIYRLVVLFTEKPVPPGSSGPTTATTHSLSSSSLSYPSDTASEISDSASSGSARRRRRKLSRQRRSALARQTTAESGRTVSSSVDGADTTHSIEAEDRQGKGHGAAGSKLKRKSSVGSPSVARAIKHDSDSSTSKAKKKSSEGKIDVGRSNLDISRTSANSGGEHHRGQVGKGDKAAEKARKCRNDLKGEVGKKVKKIEKQTATQSSPHQTSDTGSGMDDDEERRKVKATGSPHKTGGGKKSKDKSKKSEGRENQRSPHSKSGGHHGRHNDRHHRHNQIDEEFYDDDYDEDDNNRRTKSPRHGWATAKDLKNALAFMSETGEVRTVVLKPGDDGRTLYVVDPQ